MGSVSFSNITGSLSATNFEFLSKFVGKSVGNFLLSVNVVSGTQEQLHSRCRDVTRVWISTTSITLCISPTSPPTRTQLSFHMQRWRVQGTSCALVPSCVGNHHDRGTGSSATCLVSCQAGAFCVAQRCVGYLFGTTSERECSSWPVAKEPKHLPLVRSWEMVWISLGGRSTYRYITFLLL